MVSPARAINDAPDITPSSAVLHRQSRQAIRFRLAALLLGLRKRPLVIQFTMSCSARPYGVTEALNPFATFAPNKKSRT